MADKFFQELRNHSNAKIEILSRYYIPWLRKITLGAFNQNKCLVIDGFAGEGIYADGQIGSPIILIDGARGLDDQNLQCGRERPTITILLIEGNEKIYIQLIHNILRHYDDAEYTDNLITFRNYPTIKVIAINNTFENVMNSFLEQANSRLIPSFCFVDPFGFSHTPFQLLKKYLENHKAEILFNFMYEEINRFILSDKDPKLVETYKNLFGVENLDELRHQVNVASGSQLRKELIINYYAKQLLEKTEAQYALNFEFKKSGRTKMFLVHSTKNKHGLALMKEVMWKVDETGAFLYDDRKDTDQIEFEFFDDYTKKEHIKNLSEIVYNEFKGKIGVSLDTIEMFVLEKTIYPLTNYFKPAMKLLEKNEFIYVERAVGANKGSFNEKTKYIIFSNSDY